MITDSKKNGCVIIGAVSDTGVSIETTIKLKVRVRKLDQFMVNSTK